MVIKHSRLVIKSAMVDARTEQVRGKYVLRSVYLALPSLTTSSVYDVFTALMLVITTAK